MTQERSVIILEAPWYRCENGCEFRCGENKPPSCPICRSTKIEMVPEVDRRFQAEGK